MRLMYLDFEGKARTRSRSRFLERENPLSITIFLQI
jgi:hypothetical protein